MHLGSHSRLSGGQEVVVVLRSVDRHSLLRQVLLRLVTVVDLAESSVSRERGVERA